MSVVAASVLRKRNDLLGRLRSDQATGARSVREVLRMLRAGRRLADSAALPIRQKELAMRQDGREPDLIQTSLIPAERARSLHDGSFQSASGCHLTLTAATGHRGKRAKGPALPRAARTRPVAGVQSGAASPRPETAPPGRGTPGAAAREVTLMQKRDGFQGRRLEGPNLVATLGAGGVWEDGRPTFLLTPRVSSVLRLPLGAATPGVEARQPEREARSSHAAVADWTSTTGGRRSRTAAVVALTRAVPSALAHAQRAVVDGPRGRQRDVEAPVAPRKPINNDVLPYPGVPSARGEAGRRGDMAGSAGPIVVTLSGNVVVDGRQLGRMAASSAGDQAAMPAAGPARLNLRATPVFSGTQLPW